MRSFKKTVMKRYIKTGIFQLSHYFYERAVYLNQILNINIWLISNLLISSLTKLESNSKFVNRYE